VKEAKPGTTTTKIYVRWMFEGAPRHRVAMSLFRPSMDVDLEVQTVEGVFVYEVGGDGRVVVHRVEALYPRWCLFRGFKDRRRSFGMVNPAL
jgi:hypothetical protein